MRVAGLAIAVVLGLSGCATLGSLANGVSAPFRGGGLRGSQSEIDGLRFRTRLSDTGDGRAFTTVTRGAVRGPAAAAEAGRVQAVEYCLRRFGGSEILWSAGPEAAADGSRLDGSGALVLAGVCVSR